MTVSPTARCAVTVQTATDWHQFWVQAVKTLLCVIDVALSALSQAQIGRCSGSGLTQLTTFEIICVEIVTVGEVFMLTCPTVKADKPDTPVASAAGGSGDPQPVSAAPVAASDAGLDIEMALSLISDIIPRCSSDLVSDSTRLRVLKLLDEAAGACHNGWSVSTTYCNGIVLLRPEGLDPDQPRSGPAPPPL